jgi:hypothetical protein
MAVIVAVIAAVACGDNGHGPDPMDAAVADAAADAAVDAVGDLTVLCEHAIPIPGFGRRTTVDTCTGTKLVDGCPPTSANTKKVAVTFTPFAPPGTSPYTVLVYGGRLSALNATCTAIDTMRCQNTFAIFTGTAYAVIEADMGECGSVDVSVLGGPD